MLPYQVKNVLLLNQLMVCYFLQNKKALGQGHIRYLGAQMVHLLVSTCAILASGECVNSESTHILFPSEEKGFGTSAYAVHWDPDHPPVGKYLCYKSYQLEIVLVLNQLIVCYFLQKKTAPDSNSHVSYEHI